MDDACKRSSSRFPIVPTEPPPPADSLEHVARDVIACERCPRLRAWCTEVASEKRRAYRDWTYWGRPVPGFGDPRARLFLLGLAPAAHGANRTGRMFTGDSSGEWLYRALHRAGFANQATAVSRDDGLTLAGAYIGAVCRCAPPGNRPEPDERRACAGYLDRELAILAPGLRCLLALGGIAWQASLEALARAGLVPPGLRPRPRFAHGAEWRPAAPGAPVLLGSYHPSRQNTNTGRLREEAFDRVFARARELCDAP